MWMQVSPWESDAGRLQTFLNRISASGGTHWQEAVEIALQHANEENEKDPLAQVTRPY